MLLREKIFDVRLGNCSTPRVLIFCRFTGFTKMQILTQLLDGRSDKLLKKGLHDTDLNTLSTQTSRGQELLGHIIKHQINGIFFFINHKKGF